MVRQAFEGTRGAGVGEVQVYLPQEVRRRQVDEELAFRRREVPLWLLHPVLSRQ